MWIGQASGLTIATLEMFGHIRALPIMNSNSLLQQLQQIDARKAEWDRLQPVAADRLQKINRKIRLEWNYNSNAIEGNRINLGETRALITQNITPAGKSFEEVRDIQGHDRAITLVYDWIARKQRLSEIAIRDLHSVLLVEEHEVEAQTESGAKTRKLVRLGRYKEEQNFVAVGGRRVLYTLPQDVTAEMDKLLTWYRDETSRGTHPVIITSVFHHRFTRIHPFDDGNGRLGRLLLNFILMEQNYVPLILPVSEREAYIAALRAGDANEDALTQLTLFIAGAELAALELHCRGARGENVDEITDLDKEVLMLKQQFNLEDEPLVKTRETLTDCLHHSVFPLLNRTVQKLSEFDEFFREAQISVNVDNAGGQKTPDEIVHTIELMLHEKQTINRIELTFDWRNFKKGGLNIFDHQVGLSFFFQDLKWMVSSPRIERLYQQQLSEDDIRKIVDTLRRDVLNAIQQQAPKR